MNDRASADPLLRDFVRLVRGRTRTWVRRGMEAHAGLLGPGAEDVEDVERIGGGRAAHPLVTLPDGTRALVRRYRRGGLVRHLNRATYFLGRRATDELRATERARAGGVRVPRVLAATERRGRIGYAAWLATEWVPASREAAAWLEDAGEEERRAMLREAGRQVGRMHAAGVAHPDLNLRNLLVSGGERTEEGAPAVRLLDFDRARLFDGPVPPGRRAGDLRRLARSVRKLDAPVGAAGWAALSEGYGAGWPLPPDFRP